MKTRRNFLASGVALAVPPALGACTYGPPFDASRVQSAVLSSDGRFVAFAFQEFWFRPATGLAAFPDGGISLPVIDRTSIRAAPIAGGPARLLQQLENGNADGGASVALRVFDADPDHMLVARSLPVPGSGRSDLRWWRLSWRDGGILPYPDLKRELAARARSLGSRKFGDLRVLDTEGALLIGARSNDTDELWIRTAAGAYRLFVGPFDHFYGQNGDELYYWAANEAVVKNWRTGESRTVARYDPVARRTERLHMDDPTVRAIEERASDARAPAVSINARSVVVRWPDGREKAFPAGSS